MLRHRKLRTEIDLIAQKSTLSLLAIFLSPMPSKLEAILSKSIICAHVASERKHLRFANVKKTSNLAMSGTIDCSTKNVVNESLLLKRVLLITLLLSVRRIMNTMAPMTRVKVSLMNPLLRMKNISSIRFTAKVLTHLHHFCRHLRSTLMLV